jgi:hypothetical protein
MNKVVAHRVVKKVTIRRLHTELQRLRRRVEDLEDLRDLNAAIERNSDKPGIPWSQVKKELGL